MTRTIHGVVHGRTIRFDEDLGVADGQEVEVVLNIISNGTKAGDGLHQCAGALADDPHWDAIMNGIYHDRKQDARRDVPE